MRGEDVQGSKFYAVRVGRVPGIYTNWPSALEQITGWTRPEHQSFDTHTEAQQFLDSGDFKSSSGEAKVAEHAQRTSAQADTGEPTTKKPKKGIASAVKGRYVESTQYVPGVNLPPGAQDGFDRNILLGPDGGNILVPKTSSQMVATKLQATVASADSMLRIYTDGSALRNGHKTAFAGVGVYFGPSDPRRVLLRSDLFESLLTSV